MLAAARDAILAGNGDFEIAEVARRAGVSTGLAYHHFGSKSGLVEAVVHDFYDRYDAVINEPRGRGRPWFEREAERLEKTIAFLFAEPLAPLILTRISATPEVARVEHARRAQVISLAAANIARAQARGEIDPGLDPDLAAAYVNGGLREAVVRWIDAGRPRKPKLFVQQVWPLVAAGLKPSPEPRADGGANLSRQQGR